jgi:hypothetical protein
MFGNPLRTRQRSVFFWFPPAFFWFPRAGVGTHSGRASVPYFAGRDALRECIPTPARGNENFKMSYSKKIRSNPFLLALQLFAWLIFCPSRWRQYFATFNLPADFNLVSQWRCPIIRHLLIIILFIWPLFVGSIVILGLYVIGRPLPNLVMSVTYGIIITGVAGFFGALIVSTAFAMVASIFSGLTIGLAHGDMSGLWTILGIIFALGAAGSVLDSLTETPNTPALVRQLSSIMFGIVISGLIFGLGSGFLWLVAKWFWPFWFKSTEFDAIYVQLIGAILALGLTLGWYHFHRWTIAWMVGIGLTVLIILLLYVVSIARQATENEWIAILGTAISVGAVHSIFFPILWALPYLMVKRLTNTWNGVIAGTLSSGGFYVGILIVTDKYPASLIIPLSLISFWLGLTFNSWRPWLFYPFVVAWHQLLAHAEEQRSGAILLSWHAAFWDEHQRLPLFGLDSCLVQVYERNPKKGQAAIDYISHSLQNWAAKTAQIELDARRLERCDSITAIAQVHHDIMAGELLENANSILRSFSHYSQDVGTALQYTNTYYQRLALREVQERLEKLFRELTQTSHAVRFQPIVHQWQHILGEHTQQLTAVVETRQEIENPYVVGLPLDEQQTTFVGRQTISTQLEELLLKPLCPPLLLYGQRRMGKTSLLYNLGRLLPKTIIPLFVDVQGGLEQANDAVDFWYTLSQAMRQSAEYHRHLQLPALTREALAVAPFSIFNEWLDEVERCVTPARLLLMLDEFAALDEVFAQNRLDKHSILGMLRHQIQHRPRLKILLAGSFAIQELQHWASYLVNVRTVHLSYLTEAETLQLIECPLPNFGLRYDKAACQRILELTRGHPALVQSLCHELVILKNQQAITKRRLAKKADVEEAVPYILATVELFFAEILQNQVDDNGRQVLSYLAAQEEGAIVNQAILAQQCPSEQWKITLAKLRQRELIEPVGSGYRFQVELVRRAFIY